MLHILEIGSMDALIAAIESNDAAIIRRSASAFRFFVSSSIFCSVVPRIERPRSSAHSNQKQQ